MKYDYDLNLNENDSLYKIIQKINKNSTILEIGPATGRLTKFLKEEYDCNVYIIEIDQEGFNKAINYAVDGICDSIERLDLSAIFNGIKFDYVIFADVLEHLRDPQKVISDIRVNYPDALVLCSVPNIAHNAVIIELLNNRFEYNNLGLLDNTHIHFFTYNSFVKMAEESGYKIKSQDYTVAPVGELEIVNSYDEVPMPVAEALKNRELSNAYQFVFELVNADKVHENFKVKPIDKKISNYFAQLYYGNELSENNSIKCRFDLDETELIFDLTKLGNNDYRYLRLDLINSSAIIEIKYISIDLKYVNFLSNEDYLNDKVYFFCNEPELLIDLENNNIKNPKELRIQFNVIQDYCTKEIINIIKDNVKTLLINKVEFLNKFTNNCDLDEVINAINAMKEKNDKLINELAIFKDNYNAVINSRMWRFTKPFRKFNGFVKKVLMLTPVTRIPIKVLLSIKRNGVKNTAKKIKAKIYKKPGIISAKELRLQRKTKFDKEIKFSILVPLYNTPINFLEEMINSVINQTYCNWELCLADGSDKDHKYVEDICKKYAKKDKRIKYKKLEKNLGISENTNKCAEMATGEYIALFDHDDLYYPNALFENAKAINEHNPDVIYSDEDKVDQKGKRCLPFFKPDWSRDLLYSHMYICHLLVFKTSLFKKIGGFYKDFDGSQDYDLMLRLSEYTENIYHIPKILYSWRITESSTSVNPDSKPYAHSAGLNALDSHLKRMYGDIAYAEETDMTFVYSPRFKYLLNQPKISIIIPMKDNCHLSDDCIKSIINKSTYMNYEILILDNNSEKDETFKWFDTINNYDNRIRILPAKFEFNWSKLNNFGIKNATGDVFIFLNNDIVVISEDWIERLCENALRDDIGVVGPMLLYDDYTIQHAGVVVGMYGWADHVYKGQPPIHFSSPYVSPMVNRNVLAVTGACMAISRKTIEKIGLFDEEFIICGSDVEICIRAYEYGLRNLYVPFANLYHLESKSRDSFIPEIDFVKSSQVYAPYRLNNSDPYYNINLDINSVVPKRKY